MVNPEDRSLAFALCLFPTAGRVCELAYSLLDILLAAIILLSPCCVGSLLWTMLSV